MPKKGIFATVSSFFHFTQLYITNDEIRHYRHRYFFTCLSFSQAGDDIERLLFLFVVENVRSDHQFINTGGMNK